MIDFIIDGSTTDLLHSTGAPGASTGIFLLVLGLLFFLCGRFLLSIGVRCWKVR